jgi:hypothetical protein
MVQVPLSDGTTRDGLRFNPNALNVQTVVIEARVGEDDTQAHVALTFRRAGPYRLEGALGLRGPTPWTRARGL